MSRDAGGTYSLASGTNASFGEKPLASSKWNAAFNDLASEMTDSLSRSGKGAMLAHLDIGGFNIVNAVTVTATTFSGSGASLTALNATQLTSGTVPDARFPATLPALSGVNLTALNATQLTSGTVPSARVAGAYTAITAIGNTTSAISIAAAGNVTMASVSTGTTLVVNNISTGASNRAIDILAGAGVATGLEIAANGNTLATTSLFVGQGSSGIAFLFQRANLDLLIGTNATTRVTVAAAGNVTIAAPSSGTALTVTGDAKVTTTSTSTPLGILVEGDQNKERIQVQASGGGIAGIAVVYAMASRGTPASPTAVQSGDVLGYFGVGGYDGSTWSRSVWYRGEAAQNFTGSNRGSNASIHTTPLNSTAITERVKIGSEGNVTINAPSSGTALTLNALTTNAALLATDGTVSVGLYTQGATNTLTFGTDTNHGLQIRTNAASRIAVAAAGNVTIAAPSSGVALTVTGAALTPTSSQSFSATPTFNASLSNYFEMGAMTANVTSVTISNPTGGQTITIRFKQDGTGGRTVATPSGAKISGSVGLTANASSFLTLTYSTADSRWEGSYTLLPA